MQIMEIFINKLKFYMPFTWSIHGVIGYFLAPFFIFMPIIGYSTWSGCFLAYFMFALFVSSLVASALLWSHFDLILRNQTEWERKRGINMYSRGKIFNFKLVFGPYPSLALLTIFCPRLNVRSRELDCIYGRPQYTKIM